MKTNHRDNIFEFIKYKIEKYSLTSCTVSWVTSPVISAVTDFLPRSLTHIIIVFEVAITCIYSPFFHADLTHMFEYQIVLLSIIEIALVER